MKSHYPNCLGTDQCYCSDRDPSITTELSIPTHRPIRWERGMLAIDHITIRPDDDPDPPCIIMIVLHSGENECVCIRAGQHVIEKLNPRNMLGVSEALAAWDNHDDMSVKSHRIGREKLAKLAAFQTPKAWLDTMDYWADHPSDRPDDYNLIKDTILG